MINQLKRTPNFRQFLKVLKRQGRPSYLPFYEHIASPGFIARRTGTDFEQMSPDDPAYWKVYTDFWLGMGFDCVPMEVPLDCPLKQAYEEAVSHGSEAHAVIKTTADFETYPWPDLSSPLNFKPFEIVAGLLPEGAKIVGGVAFGPYEWVSRMMGVVGLSYALMDKPELVGLVFKKIGKLIVSANHQLASMEAVGALRQGDDLGFKTATFLNPARLREHVFPIYAEMVRAAHEPGKPYILHCCGNLAAVYEDIIACRFDAKHSFEDVILPVDCFKKMYGSRITPLGGLDVDFICRRNREEIRAYTRQKIGECFDDGFWALGTGNSLTDYMPVENYITVLEEGLNFAS